MKQRSYRFYTVEITTKRTWKHVLAENEKHAIAAAVRMLTPPNHEEIARWNVEVEPEEGEGGTT